MTIADPRVDALKASLKNLYKAVGQLVVAVGQESPQRDRLLDSVKADLVDGEAALDRLRGTPPLPAQRR